MINFKSGDTWRQEGTKLTKLILDGDEVSPKDPRWEEFQRLLDAGEMPGPRDAAIDALDENERMKLVARAPKTSLEAYLLITHLVRLIPANLLEQEVRKGEAAPEIGRISHPAMWTGNAIPLHHANVEVVRRLLALRVAVAALDTALGLPPSRMELDRGTVVMPR